METAPNDRNGNPPSAVNLDLALAWISAVIGEGIAAHDSLCPPPELPPFSGFDDGSFLPRFIAAHRPKLEELAILMLALLPHLDPWCISRHFALRPAEGGDLPEFGASRAAPEHGYLPTGQTALFLLGGRDLARRLAIQSMFGPSHWFWKTRVLWLEAVKPGEPAMSGRLVVDPEIIEDLTTGRVSPPRFSQDFPAEHIETKLDWDDLVLPQSTMRQLRDIENWIRYNPVLASRWGLARHVKPGYRTLFHGLPGTGKTLTAMLLGKRTAKPVFRIDLSRLVSKYIGETEQNLSSLFDKAEHKDWILFFDEADALFGKRTEIREAHDKYANQEAAYLLQRIESYNGLVILASNQRGNIDDAFVRRLQSIITFPLPGPAERLALWRKTLPPELAADPAIDWTAVANRHELTGAGIVNVTHYCALDVLAREASGLDPVSLETAILREYVKEGRVV